MNLLEVTSTSAAVGALVISVVAIVYSIVEGRRNAQAIADERHTSLQLAVLKELLDIVNRSYYIPSKEQARSGTMRWRAIHARLRIIDSPLPRLRARYGLGLSIDEQRRVLGVTRPRYVDLNDEFVGDGRTVRDTLFDEIVGAIDHLANATPRELERLRSSARLRRAGEPALSTSEMPDQGND